MTTSRILLVYGANTQLDEWRVNADGRLAVCADGYAPFEERIVLDHCDESLWGHRDELFRIISFNDHGIHYVYYSPHESPATE